MAVAGAGRRAAGTDGIAGRAGNMRLRASTLPFLPRTGGSSTERLEKSTGSLRMAETAEETLDPLADGWAIAMATSGTQAVKVETQAAGAS